MREIKFRGKMNHGAWVYGDLLYHSNCYSASIATDEEHCWPIKPNTVGQFTGLKDSEEHEIYEGDIIQSEYAEYLAVVEFRKGAFVAMTGPVDTYQALYGVLRLKGLRVIGNAHDNPELLERMI